MPAPGRSLHHLKRLNDDFVQVELSAELEETDEEAKEFNDRVAEEIRWKTERRQGETTSKSPVAPHLEQYTAPSQESPPQVNGVPSLTEPLVTVSSTAEAAPASTAQPSPPSFHPSHIVKTSTPRLANISTIPIVPTPSFATTPLARQRTTPHRGAKTAQADTPENVDSPIDTPGPSRPIMTLSEGRGRRDDPATPVPLGTEKYVVLAGKKEYQTLTKHFELFNRQATKQHTKQDSRSKGATTAPGLGARVFEGLRFCFPPEMGNTSKQKQWWGVVLSRGGQVTLQPDTAITHVIHNAGRSAQLLARQLGLQSLSELPAGTVCVKWDWVVKCMMEGKLLDTTPWLSFPQNTFTRSVSAMHGQKRMVDITDLLRAKSVSISRKRGPTASDSDTESPQKPPRMPIPPRPPSRKLYAKPNIQPTIATKHELPSGPGWLDVGASDRDGLDEMISGLKNGSISDEVQKEVLSDVENAEAVRPSSPPRSEQLEQLDKSNVDHYKCGRSNDGTASQGPNEWLAKKFEAMHDMYQGAQHKNTFQVRGYQKAAGVMRRVAWPIKSGQDALRVKGIGQGMADRIDEWISGVPGRQFYETTEQVQVLQVFKDIYGIGKTRANELYQKGARSIEDLKSGRFELTEGQKIGLELYDDLKTRIPREECKQIYEIVRAEALTIDPKLEIEIMGSYRRGASDSGDVDFLITRDDTIDGQTHEGVLQKLIVRLLERGVITHSLSSPGDWKALEVKWMGVCRLTANHLYRRIDILCIPFEQWGAALIYFTGNDIFNRSLRLYARKKGYRLNQRGLYTGVICGQDGSKLTEGEIIASRTEKEIFDVLGIRWRAPHHRRP